MPGTITIHLMPVMEVLTANQQHVISPKIPVVDCVPWETNSETLGLHVDIFGGVLSETAPIRGKGSRIRQKDFKCNAVAIGAPAGPLVNGSCDAPSELL